VSLLLPINEIIFVLFGFVDQSNGADSDVITLIGTNCFVVKLRLSQIKLKFFVPFSSFFVLAGCHDMGIFTFYRGRFKLRYLT
jgi:hypothetical protein